MVYVKPYNLTAMNKRPVPSQLVVFSPDFSHQPVVTGDHPGVPFGGGPFDRAPRRNELMALLGDLPPDDLDSYLKNAFVLVKAREFSNQNM